MKKIFITSCLFVATLGFFSGCSTETAWVNTPAMVETFCGGLVYLEGTRKEAPAVYGVYLDIKGTNVDLSFVDIASYNPGQAFVPVEGQTPLTISKTLVEVQNSIETEESMELLFKDVFATISGEKSVNDCDVKYTDATICTLLNGAYSCTANIVCDGRGISVNYIFKAFEEECPPSGLIKVALATSLPAPDQKEPDQVKPTNPVKPSNPNPDKKKPGNTDPGKTEPEKGNGGYNSEIE